MIEVKHLHGSEVLPNIIEVSAVVIQNAEGHVLNVRKRGTSTLMLPGGKPEPGEDPRDTAIREFREELGVELDPLHLRGLGTFRSPAANEPGHEVVAHVFEHPFISVDRPRAEIEHLEWADPALYASGNAEQLSAMAPLNIEHVFPALARGIHTPKRITVYTGSALGNDPVYAAGAREFGAALAKAGIGVVYGGGKVGLMGTLADGALLAGGEVIGVITEALLEGETGHRGLTRLEVVKTMQERKFRMAELTDAFVAMPGGPGTLEEFFEVLAWLTLGIHTKPVALLNVNGYWEPLLATLDSMVEAGFTSPAARSTIIVARDAADLLEQVSAWQPPRPKWS